MVSDEILKSFQLLTKIICEHYILKTQPSENTPLLACIRRLKFSDIIEILMPTYSRTDYFSGGKNLPVFLSSSNVANQIEHFL